MIGGAPYLAAFSTRFQRARFRRAAVGREVRRRAGGHLHPPASRLRPGRAPPAPGARPGARRRRSGPGARGRPVASSRAVVSTSSISRSSSPRSVSTSRSRPSRVAVPRQEGERHPDAGKRRAQLVGDVGEELLLALDQPLDPLRHVVEGAGQVAEFVGPPAAGRSRASRRVDVARGTRGPPPRAGAPPPSGAPRLGDAPGQGRRRERDDQEHEGRRRGRAAKGRACLSAAAPTARSSRGPPRTPDPARPPPRTTSGRARVMTPARAELGPLRQGELAQRRHRPPPAPARRGRARSRPPRGRRGAGRAAARAPRRRRGARPPAIRRVAPAARPRAAGRRRAGRRRTRALAARPTTSRTPRKWR